MSDLHPCQKCGACCASFRVAFYWMEEVPEEYSVDLDISHKCMKGTEVKHQPKCVALKGRVGSFVGCEIYDKRSSTCRNFQASYEDGIHRPRCDEARAKHGMKPLQKNDWEKLNEPAANDL